MAERLKPELCVIGAGVAGLSAAAGAAALGVSVVLVEKGRIGGERLNTGGVPSKAMIASGRRAEVMRTSDPFGVQSAPPAIAFDQVNDHIHQVIEAIEPSETKERLTALGVRVIEGEARFTDARTVTVGSDFDPAAEISAWRFVIATGSRPLVPSIPGLDQVAYLTNENAFEIRERPQHLIVLGANAVALETALAFRRLGSEVTVLDEAEPLAGEDPECVAILLDALAREGLTVRGGVKFGRVRALRQRIEVVLAGGAEEAFQGTDLLLALGRRPNIEGLNLEAARIKHEPIGIAINRRFATSNSHVFAIGDVNGLPRFSHSAQRQAALLVRHLVLRQSITFNAAEIPRVVFTDPELAHVGLTDADATARRGAIRVLRWPYRDNDRAQIERQARGHIKVVTDAGGTVLGATIVGQAASEQIAAWSLAVKSRLNIRAFADMVVPYPTYMEAGQRAAQTFFTPRLTGNWLRRMLDLLRRFR